MSSEKLDKAFNEFHESVQNNGILEPKTTRMLFIATAMALGCSHWIEHFLGVARKEGITDDEISAVQSIVMAVSAGRVRAQVRDARIKNKKADKEAAAKISG
jgi:alkylhydroperoxidase/carboxymuconolactone decarboxylase family protein YurZ